MKLVPVNEQGRVIGEAHHRARVADLIVDLIRELHDTGLLGYSRIGKVVGIPKACVQKIVTCRTRAQYPVDFKRVA